MQSEFFISFAKGFAPLSIKYFINLVYPRFDAQCNGVYLRLSY